MILSMTKSLIRSYFLRNFTMKNTFYYIIFYGSTLIYIYNRDYLDIIYK